MEILFIILEIVLKLLINSEISIVRNAIEGAEGRRNKPVLKRLTSLLKMYLKLNFL